MNKIISKLIATLIIGLFAFTSVSAQEAKTMYIMKNGMILYQSVVSDIDSLIFYNPGISTSPSLTLTMGTGANAPFTPLLTNNTVAAGTPVYLGIQVTGTTEWLNRTDFTLTSGNTSVATINASGTIAPVATGSTVIRAVRNSDGATGMVTLTVSGIIAPPPTSLTLTLGTQPNAPYTPLLANNTTNVGNMAYLGIQVTGTSTWLSRLDHTLTSSDTSVATISETGAITALATGTTVIRAVRISDSATGEITFTVIAGGPIVPETRVAGTMYVDRPANFTGTFSNTAIIDGTLQLTGTNTSGTYTSQEFSTVNFSQVVGSWSVSHIDIPGSTVEIEYRLRTTGGTWSSWFTSSQWAFAPGTNPNRQACNLTDKGNNIRGHHNGDGVARMENNRIGWLNTYDRFQYRVTLRRANGTNASPKGKAFSTTLLSSNLTGDTFPTPAAARSWTISQTLRQQNVPTIGGDICSPTTVTMLMMHKGISHFDGCEFPHEWTANKVVRAPNTLGANNGLFGNWVFATAAMGSWAKTDYVAYARYIYSANELADLLTRGPVAMSIQGNAAANGPLICMAGITRYSGAGHLIVIRGFEMSDGQVSAFLVNDPNNPGSGNTTGQIYRVTPTNMMRVNVSRMIYVLE